MNSIIIAIIGFISTNFDKIISLFYSLYKKVSLLIKSLLSQLVQLVSSKVLKKTKYILYIKHDYSSGTCKWILQDIEGNDLQVSRDFNNSDFALNNAKSKLGFKHPIRITEYLYEIYLHSEH